MRNLCYNATMNSYDFDDTIFRGNSMRRFSIFCTLRLPYLLLYLPVILVVLLLRAVRILNKNVYLLLLEGFVVFVPHTDRFVCKFWDKNLCRIKRWYLDQQRSDDIVVSATPFFLVGEACRRLGVECVASIVTASTRCATLPSDLATLCPSATIPTLVVTPPCGNLRKGATSSRGITSPWCTKTAQNFNKTDLFCPRY